MDAENFQSPYKAIPQINSAATIAATKKHNFDTSLYIVDTINGEPVIRMNEQRLFDMTEDAPQSSPQQHCCIIDIERDLNRKDLGMIIEDLRINYGIPTHADGR